MKIESIKKDGDEKMTFTLSDASLAYANALRRTLISEVPVMAVDEVDFYENNSVLFDEFIASRLALIPLNTDLKHYVMPQDCKEPSCSKCSEIFSLDVEGPGIVYSKSLKPKNKDLKPVFDDIPIMKLDKGQRLRLEAKAVLGRAKDHGKFKACFATYNMPQHVELAPDSKTPGAYFDACDKHYALIKQKKSSADDLIRCESCRESRVADAKQLVRVVSDKTRFDFKIESYGNLEVKEVFKKALEILEEKTEGFEKALKE